MDWSSAYEKIKDYLRDPAWWFSAFVIAIVASVLAAYIKEWISLFLSSISRRFRMRRRRGMRERVAVIRAMEQDSGYMVQFSVRHSMQVVISVVVMLAAASVPNIAALALLILLPFLTARMAETRILFSRGIARYKRRRGLPLTGRNIKALRLPR